MHDIGPTPAPKDQAGFGLLSTVIALLIVALLGLGALKALAGRSSTGSNSQALSPVLTKAYDIQAQSALSTAMRNVRDDAIGNGGLSGLDLAPLGVTTGPSSSPTQVSGAVTGASLVSGGLDAQLGSGSATLAADSRSGTCWFVWLSASATWFGYEPDATACVAQPMAEPSAGRASPGTVGWQKGSFPVTG